ncbi:hypothetical protein D3C84_884370 [compost metagenome]
MFKQQVKRLDPRGRGHDLPILTLQQGSHAEQVFRVIINNQKDRAVFAERWLRAFHAASLIGRHVRFYVAKRTNTVPSL